MRRILQQLFVFAALLATTACLFSTPASAQRLEPVADGLRTPVSINIDDAGRLYFVSQAGVVRVYQDGALLPDPFIDLSDRISTGGERGLLGLALSGTDRAFAYYTGEGGVSILARYAVKDGVADASTEKVLMRVDQPFANHNGGELTFGPDGYLYWALGDGGSGGDPNGNGQNLGTLLATILRLDVSGDGVSIPADNPFVGKDGARGEIWQYGLRNPWRFSFDRDTGDLYIGDVGQNRTEEIDMLPAGRSGVNFGWNVMEGDHCYQPREGCDTAGKELPIVVYPHDADWGNSVTGGYVYRGSALPALVGKYVFADFGSGRVWTATPHDDGTWSVDLLLETGFNVPTFGQDAEGELYLADYGGGMIYKLVP